MKEKIVQEKRKKCPRFWIIAALFISIIWICPAAVSAESAVIDSGMLSITPWNEEKGKYDKEKGEEYYTEWQLTEDGVLTIEGIDGMIDSPGIDKYPWKDHLEKIVKVEFGAVRLPGRLIPILQVVHPASIIM